MGFPEAWISLIERCVSTCWFSVLINGAPSGFFRSTRGLRQGDPISPALFVIAAEYLSRALDKLILGQKEMVFKAARHCMEISHLAYADDIIIFTQAAAPSIRRLRACLEDYAEVSGQQINLAKSNFYIAEIHEGWAGSIHSEGGFSQGTFPFLYLGVPIFRGVKRTDMFMFLREKVASRISGWAHRHLSFGGRLTLIKSTLEAVPLHIFQAIEPTAGALKQIDQQLARFFWGSTNERKKTHWIGWDQICLPTAEGGLGIRKSKEVLRAFNVKLWWRFREQNSLWATYMMAKYCSTASPLVTRPLGRSSPTWKRLMKTRAQAQPHIRWVVGKGKIYFWDDIWLGNYTLRDLALDDRRCARDMIGDYIRDGLWDEPKLQLLHAQAGLPQHIIYEILGTPIVHGEPDIPRWNISRLGDFSLATTWETIRNQGPIIRGLDEVWKAGLTHSISIFIWRLLSNRVPVDTKLQWRKIEMASKCQCCPFRPSIESLQHLFIQGSGATRVWREFDGWFEGSSPSIRINDTIPDRLEVWARRTQQNSMKHLSHVMPYLIMWFLWAERNRSRHQMTQFKAYNVVWQVQTYIRNSMSNGSIKRKHWRGVKINLQVPAEAESRPSRPLAVSIKWHPPDRAWIKINTDGAFLQSGDKAGGGGIVRDNKGRMLAAFATPLQAHSALEAELKAIHQGIILAKEFNRPIWLEVDSEQALNLLNGTSWGPPQVRHEVARLIVLKRHTTLRSSFIHREGNKVADFLAKMGAEQPEYQRLTVSTTPRLLKAMIRMEEMGIPNIRVRDEESI